ncbi:hypothetical protein [uncultured Brevibacterium sp.]|uniref:hypothetical protein n=1 Tax=uncultured Brevibacterium sp. TaxID=189678 RepID=UPI0025E93817|nr:hypothetical protein [uncultured Brevibacterium sp.]
MTGPPTRLEETGLLRGALSRPWIWDALTAVVSGLLALYIVHVYYPGRANVDIVSQARQALGEDPYSDWHPPLVSAVWEVLIDLTGEIGSLLVVQVGMLFLTAWLLAVLLHRRTGRRELSLLGVALPLLPWALSQIGMLWKDTQMAVALLLAVFLLFLVRPERRLSLLLLVPSGLLLLFAIGARKNAVFAIVPIAVYIAWLLLRVRSTRPAAVPDADAVPDAAGSTPAAGIAAAEPGGSSPLPRFAARRVLALAGASLAVLAVLGAGTVGIDRALVATKDVQSTGQISQIMLDDVMFSVPESELRAADAPDALKDKISAARDVCIEQGEIWDAYWNCYGRGIGGKGFAPIEHREELTSLWLQTVPTHPVRYLEYRMAVFSHYFFSSRFEYWPIKWDGDASTVGLGEGSRNGEYIIRPYVEDFALGTFPMLFKPWFWFVGAVVCLALLPRLRMLRAEIAMLASSSLFYILGYIPIAPANHFRYTYWPALAVTAALILVLAAWRTRRPSPLRTP